MTQFTDLDLVEPLQRALTHEGYHAPTPIQARAIPPVLAGRDLLGCAQTGTGKTAAFLLPALQHLSAARGPRRAPAPRALVLTPTRELAAQIGASATAYGRFLDLEHTVIFGGTGEGPQIRALRRGVDLLVATPGRLLDLLGRGHVDLAAVELFVLDEADRMLDMGFIRDVERVIARLPGERRNLLFSATLPPKITALAGSFLEDPVSVSVTPTATTVERIDQTVRFMERAEKRPSLIRLLQEDDEVESAIVFTRTKHGADRLAKQLTKAGVEAAAIHGNKSQGARTRSLEGFRRGGVRVLVATDLASRGLDVEDVSHVVNFDLPKEPDTYVHRIGRTARAGRPGTAISLCDPGERELLRDIERTIGQRVPVAEGARERAPATSARADAAAGPSPDGARRDRGRSRSPAAGKRRARARGGRSRPGREEAAAAHRGRRQDGPQRTERTSGPSGAAVPSFGRAGRS